MNQDDTPLEDQVKGLLWKWRSTDMDSEHWMAVANPVSIHSLPWVGMKMRGITNREFTVEGIYSIRGDDTLVRLK